MMIRVKVAEAVWELHEEQEVQDMLCVQMLKKDLGKIIVMLIMI